MGLFDFLKSAGDKLWDPAAATKDDKEKKLKEHLDSLGIKGADQVNVNVDDNGKVTVSGEGIVADMKNKILVALGNVAGVEKVEDHIAGGSVDVQHYTVVAGDTLSAIAKKVYGDANLYQQIFEANKPMLKDPNKIYPGQVLIIPKR
ncbi:peptidoglycan-binding protein LysM [Arsenophonus nasoniae]|nr:peptidoglycan-binding protein LysM [Arsenophonus nasoniae]QBY44256.1 LysM domain protein [Arsenophonus nasoniae]WGL96376.1 peptidoglycan-binding protein LysM [Arsenophonus nasoniae]WGM00555.1 peptidoglycan-binding protein LysM [Arsenophonus nasoniae]WGM04539.1 peptidoglycan-binding protein LysM [Arsenophonus nasoniae]WGM09648.1 peptidoglycan-binding protein LysM [Arsenophonus nasoniae]